MLSRSAEREREVRTVSDQIAISVSSFRGMRAMLVFFLWAVLTFVVAASPAPGSSSAPSQPRKRPTSDTPAGSRRAVRPSPPPAAEEEGDDEEEEIYGTNNGTAAAATAQDEVTKATISSSSSSGSSSSSSSRSRADGHSASSGSKKKSKRKAKRRSQPPPTLLDGLQERLSSYVETAKETLAEKRAEQRALAEAYAQRLRAAEEVGGSGGDVVDEGGELSLFERGALFGSLLMAPAGVPGIIVGGAFGGAAGYVAERIDQVRKYVSDAYGERVATEQTNAAEMAKASEALAALDQIRVMSKDPTEAAELAAALEAFLDRPCNRRCADCAVELETRNSAWAVVNQGVLVCKHCAACHRSLGVSVSRVRSVVFDRWDPTVLRAFLELGNEIARARDLARLPKGYAEPRIESPSTVPTAEEEARLKAFIELKYARLRWAEPEYRSGRLKELGAIRKGVKRLADEKVSRGGRMASLSSEG